jgi:hypothetical protein
MTFPLHLHSTNRKIATSTADEYDEYVVTSYKPLVFNLPIFFQSLRYQDFPSSRWHILNTLVDSATDCLTGIVDRECVAWRRKDYEAPQPMYMD